MSGLMAFGLTAIQRQTIAAAAADYLPAAVVIRDCIFTTGYNGPSVEMGFASRETEGSVTVLGSAAIALQAAIREQLHRIEQGEADRARRDGIPTL